MAADGDFGPPQSAARILHHGESLWQNLLEPLGQFLIVLDFRKLLLPRCRLVPQRILRPLLQRLLQRVDLRHQRPQALHFALVFGADELLYDETDHASLKTVRRYGNNGEASKT